LGQTVRFDARLSDGPSPVSPLRLSTYPDLKKPLSIMLQSSTQTSFDHAVVVSVDSKPQIDLKVLHVVNGEFFAGAERVQSHLGRCLPRFGVAADFACVKRGKFAALVDQQKGNWGQCFDAGMSNRFDFRASLRVRDLVRDHDYDLLHAHTPRSAMITSLASKLTGVPWVYHVHSPAARDSANPWSNRANSWIEKHSLEGCAHLISVSESLRWDCIARVANEYDVTVIHNGVPAIRPQRPCTPTPGGRWTVGIVALMRPRKGLEVMLDAIAKLEGEGHDVVLRCIGPFETREYEAEIDDRIRQLGIGDRIERVGFTTNVPESLAQLDAMVLPSLFGEGLPMVVLEAMAAALPVIATRVEGTPEAITDGVEGLLAQPGDASSLAEAIGSLITGRHDWSQMAEAACSRHASWFSDLTMAERTAELYRDLLL
jgi:glycosyltransferase involved in cell wall biosynthesis